MLPNSLNVTQSVRCRAQMGTQGVRLPVCAVKADAVLKGSSWDAQKETTKIEPSKKETMKIKQFSDLLVSKIREGERGIMNDGLENLVKDNLQKEEQDFAEE